MRNNEKTESKFVIRDKGKVKPEILEPKTCGENIDKSILNLIDDIDWKDLETAYGNAENTIPNY